VLTVFRRRVPVTYGNGRRAGRQLAGLGDRLSVRESVAGRRGGAWRNRSLSTATAQAMTERLYNRTDCMLREAHL